MNADEKNWAVGMLFLGISLGISGSLVASFLDRQFEKYGTVYDLFVVGAFIIFVILIERRFTKLLKSDK